MIKVFRQLGAKLGRFLKGEAGSLTIESALLYPVLFFFTIALLALGWMAYQKAGLTQASYEWSERAAYVWKDSHKDPVTGAFSYSEMDDVYSSLFSEGLGWLGASFQGFKQADIRFPGRSLTGQDLPGTKLLRSSESAGSAIFGEGAYYNRIIEGEVQANWAIAPTGLGKSLPFRLPQQLNAKASAYYADPVEFMRTVDLVTLYSAKLKERFPSPAKAEEELKDLLPGKPQAVTITSEEQAKAYLRQILNASGTSEETTLGGREIDVLDSDGFAHDAKYTVNSQQYSKQIQKDAELIRTGQVKGVVWHFFIHKDGKFAATPAMLKELEENGIMVVYHR